MLSGLKTSKVTYSGMHKDGPSDSTIYLKKYTVNLENKTAKFLPVQTSDAAMSYLTVQSPI